MTPFVIPTIYTAVDRLSAPTKVAEKSVASLADRLNKIGEKATEVGVITGLMGAAITAPIAIAVKDATDFEDKMADIAKTTGLAGQELKEFGEGILNASTKTRSSIDDLLKIGEIGGQLGVAKEELLDFTSAADKFNIALGKDYAGGVEEAITSVGKLNKLFAETKSLKISESITRTGSVINELGAQGAGTSKNINEFLTRVGTIPESIRPSLVATASLGTYFEEVGLNAEIASSGFAQLLLDGSRNLSGFAAQMKISTGAASELLAKDPAKFALAFSKSFNGLDAQSSAAIFKKLSIASNEELKVVGALGQGTERLGQLQEIANKAFRDGTSLQYEAAKKNDTLAAKVEIANNNFKVLSITIGTILIPAIGSLLDMVIPIVQTVVEWTRRHETLTKIILATAIAVGGLLLVTSAVAFSISLAAKATALWTLATKIGAFFQGVMAVATGTVTGELLAEKAAMYGVILASNAMKFALAGSILGLISLIAYFASSTSGANDLSEKIDKTTDSFKSIKKPIDDAVLALKGYNEAVEAYNAQNQRKQSLAFDVAHGQSSFFDNFKLAIRSQVDVLKSDLFDNSAPVKADYFDNPNDMNGIGNADSSRSNSEMTHKFEFYGLPAGMGVKEKSGGSGITPSVGDTSSFKTN